MLAAVRAHLEWGPCPPQWPPGHLGRAAPTWARASGRRQPDFGEVRPCFHPPRLGAAHAAQAPAVPAPGQSPPPPRLLRGLMGPWGELPRAAGPAGGRNHGRARRGGWGGRPRVGRLWPLPGRAPPRGGWGVGGPYIPRAAFGDSLPCDQSGGSRDASPAASSRRLGRPSRRGPDSRQSRLGAGACRLGRRRARMARRTGGWAGRRRQRRPARGPQIWGTQWLENVGISASRAYQPARRYRPIIRDAR